MAEIRKYLNLKTNKISKESIESARNLRNVIWKSLNVKPIKIWKQTQLERNRKISDRISKLLNKSLKANEKIFNVLKKCY